MDLWISASTINIIQRFKEIREISENEHQISMTSKLFKILYENRIEAISNFHMASGLRFVVASTNAR